MLSKLEYQIYVSEFESQWVPYSHRRYIYAKSLSKYYNDIYPKKTRTFPKSFIIWSSYIDCNLHKILFKVDKTLKKRI